MERRMPKRLPFHRLPVFPVLMAQLVVLLLAATLTWQWRGNVAGYSALLGA